MSTKTTTWRPDTCNCVFQYEWDDSVPESERTHTPTLVTPCEFHEAGETQDKYDSVVGENQMKNVAMKTILTEMPQLKKEDDDDFKDEYKPNWYFTEERNLVIETQGLTEEEKTTLNALTPEEVTIE